MRVIPILLIALALTSCDTLGIAPTKGDAGAHTAMSSRERSLIYAADGAAQQGNAPAAERDYLIGCAARVREHDL